MRPSEPGNLLNHGGDLDNRIKGLFDALCMPSSQQLPKGASPEGDEAPFFVLLEDDALVTSFSVETDRLLKPGLSNSDVEIIMSVNVTKTRSTWGNSGV